MLKEVNVRKQSRSKLHYKNETFSSKSTAEDLIQTTKDIKKITCKLLIINIVFLL